MQSDFPTVVLPLLGILGVTDALMLYAAYLSLSVWRGLAVPIFRSRAFWMALFGIPFVIAINYGLITRTVIVNTPLAFPVISEILFTFPLVTLFVWIDRMIGSVIRLDYLRRDVLYWRRLRLAYWMVVIVSNVLFFSRYIFGSILILGALVGLISLAYGSLVLVKGARTLGDMTFRSHLKWFGYYGASLIPLLLSYGIYGSSVPIPIYILLFVSAFCYYKMARFLVPIGKFTVD